jgi:hypothetical protein
VLGAISLHPIEAFVETFGMWAAADHLNATVPHSTKRGSRSHASDIRDPEAFSYSIRFFLTKVEGAKL